MKMLCVIVPIFNTATYLRECLDSLVNQSYQNICFVLINDGSTDSSEQIAREYCVRDSRFVLISQPNSGIASARNAGMQYAHTLFASNKGGGYIGFVDSDDVVSKHYFRNLIFALESHNASIAKSCDIRIFDGTQYDPKQFEIIQRPSRGTKITINTKNLDRRIEVWRSVFAYEIIKSLKFEHIKVIDDLVFSICAHTLAQHIVLVKRARYFYRQHQHSTMKTGYTDPYILLKAFEAIYTFFIQHNITSIGLPTHMLYTQAKGFAQDNKEFLRFRQRIERLQIPQALQDTIITNLLESTNAHDFIKRTMPLKEYVKNNFRIRFSKKQNIIKLFGMTLYEGKKL